MDWETCRRLGYRYLVIEWETGIVPEPFVLGPSEDAVINKLPVDQLSHILKALDSGIILVIVANPRKIRKNEVVTVDAVTGYYYGTTDCVEKALDKLYPNISRLVQVTTDVSLLDAVQRLQVPPHAIIAACSSSQDLRQARHLGMAAYLVNTN